VFGSLDERFFTQDRATVIDGRLPRLDATDEVALSPKVANRLGVGVGDDVHYLIESDSNSKTVARPVFRVVGIVKLPPVIVDENDVIEGAVLPPAASKHYVDAFYYAWQGIRLRGRARTRMDRRGAALTALAGRRAAWRPRSGAATK
jgi:hypothetical protein